MEITQYVAITEAVRHNALETAAYTSGHKVLILEKDFGVVATLRAPFNAPFANHLIFTGELHCRRYGVQFAAFRRTLTLLTTFEHLSRGWFRVPMTMQFRLHVVK